MQYGVRACPESGRGSYERAEVVHSVLGLSDVTHRAEKGGEEDGYKGGTQKKDIATRCAPSSFFALCMQRQKKARKMIMHQDITFSCPSPREEEVPRLSRAGKERWSDIYVPL